jgi:hypothetical protein
MNFSFIDEDNDKILNYEEVEKVDDFEKEDNKNEEIIESFTPGLNNPSNMNNPGTNVQHPYKPPMRHQNNFPKPNYQNHPHHNHQHYRRPPPQNNTYVYDTVVYDRPRRNYYNDYIYNPYYNPYFNPYFTPKEIDVVEIEKKEKNDSNDDSKKNEMNITNLLLFIIIIIALFYLMKKT